MRLNYLRALRALCLAFSLAGCASVPTLHGSPEDVGNAIAGNAVAYNQAYGRAIADQVLLNVLRARDRQPLYHLSMSGIQDSSELAQQLGELTIGGVSLGDGNGGVGQFVGSRTLTTKPGYTLNPFSSDDEHRARQFEPAAAEVFQHFWENNWPVEVLMLVMVDDLHVVAPHGGDINNSSGGYRGDCQHRPTAAEAQAARAAENAAIESQFATPVEKTNARAQRDRAVAAYNTRCNFVWLTQRLADSGPRPELTRVFTGCPQPPREEDKPPPPPRLCSVKFTFERVTYQVGLRAIDDMTYFVGSILRDYQDGGPAMTSRIAIHPADVYPADGEEWTNISRTAPLFRISQVDRPQHGDYAAEVTYRGAHYVAGPSSNVVCVGVEHCNGRPGMEGDASSRVLSLLTQLVIISQSEEAQLAPRNLVAQ